ncbi:hypothetical protein IFM89_036795 [Coptis chinensis]|uniref:AB hydrolase-1 domain-containing protein n=1 Tax=Coptis chinensis TaxID=261450 RepID=A0A835HSN0_9MAGN|nr:hypothetical protein IFM89_036795 [Coptis chinensis]
MDVEKFCARVHDCGVDLIKYFGLQQLTQLQNQSGGNLGGHPPVVCPQLRWFVWVESQNISLLTHKMNQIEHKFVEIRGVKLHIAELGTGDKVVVFLHGFPEIWYSWQHQMIAVANAGYRAIAPDIRGYGQFELPSEPEKATFKDLSDDVLAILDFFNVRKKRCRWANCLSFCDVVAHPERVSGVVTLGIPYTPAHSFAYDEQLPEGFYVSRWQIPGRAEDDFGRFDVITVVRNIYILFSKSDIPTAKENKEVMDMVDPSTPLPPWFTEEDLSAYAAASLHEDIRVTNTKVLAPALFVMGEKDYVLKLPGMEKYLKSEEPKEYVPNLEIVFFPEGSHFVQEQFPDKVNQLIMGFLIDHL